MFWIITLIYGIVVNSFWKNEEKSTQHLAKGICALVYAFLLYLLMGEGISDFWDLCGSKYCDKILDARYGEFGCVTYSIAAFFQLLMFIGGIIDILAYFYYRNQEDVRDTYFQMQREIEKLKKDISAEKAPATQPEEKLPTWKKVELERATKQAAQPWQTIQVNSKIKVKCPKCGNVQSSSLPYCFFCGTPLVLEEPSQKCCSKCGAKIMDNSEFCSQCGEKRD